MNCEKQKMERWFVFGIVLLMVVSVFAVVPQRLTASADYSETWSSEDGDADSTEKYVVVRDDAQKNWSLSIDVWEENQTVLIEMENIAEGTLNLSELGVNMDDLKPWIEWAGTEIDIIMRSDVHEVDITINDLPKFDDIYLNGDAFSDYTYEDETLNMTLTFSDNTLTIAWNGIGWTWIIELVWAVMTLVIVVKLMSPIFDMVNETWSN